MNPTSPPWDHYATFLAVMQGGSLSAAARQLGLTQPTTRRHIEALETALNTVLFTRTQTGLIPTDTATRLLGPAQDMAATAAALLRSASDDAASTGTIRITCSEVFGCEILPPLLATIMATHPGLTFEIDPNNTTADLMRRDADIAIRMTPPKQAALIARKLGAVQVGLHAAPAYLARTSIPQTYADLTQHCLIGEDRGHSMADGLKIRGLTPLPFAYRTDSDLAQMAAIRGGVGIGFIQTRLAHGLVRVLPDITVCLDVWLAMHEDLRPLPRLKRVYDALAETLHSTLHHP